MYDTHTRYLASAFLDATSLEVESQEIPSLMERLGEKLAGVQIIPNIVQEETASGTLARYAFIGFAGLWQWQIILGSRFQVMRTAANPFAGADLGAFDEFCPQASSIVALLLEHFEKTPYRLAAVQEGYLKEMSVDETTAIARRLISLVGTYEGHVLSEWDRRAVAEIPRDFGGLQERVNTITTIRKSAGLSIQAGETSTTLPLNRIKVDIDTNTHQANTNARFEPAHIESFFEAAVTWHRQLSAELLDQIFGN